MKRKLILNTITSILLQIVTVFCGFILPRIILTKFGSETNGLVSSIGQFLNLIAFLELGVGAVLQSALYKPLANKDEEQINKVVSSGNRFFRRIAYILVAYVIVLACSFYFISDNDFSWLFTFLLVLAMGISSFAQYYFGIIDRLLLTADQKGYIQYISQIIALLLNLVACIIVIYLGLSIQIVKLVSSIIFLARPIVLRLYVNKHYRIDWKYKTREEVLDQKWNGVGQHVAGIVLDDTDTIVLTLFSSLSNVSVYSVYYNVTYGIKSLVLSSTNGFQSVLGEYYAKDQKELLNSFFSKSEFIIHFITSLLYGCTMMLILPFVEVYTKGINDVNYIQPLFSILIVSANAVHCMRLPYHLMIKAANKYRETQLCYYIAAGINVLLSIICVIFLGLIGVAIGTLVAMLFQTIWMAIYSYKKVNDISMKHFVKQIIFDVVLIGGICLSTFWIKLQSISFLSWLLMALEVTSIGLVLGALLSLVFYKAQVFAIFKWLFRKIKK